MRECQLATTTEIRALQVGEHLVIAVEVELPTPGWDVYIRESMIDIHPPAFDVLQCMRPGAWPRVVERRRASEVFRQGQLDEIYVADAAEQLRKVPVEDLFDVEPAVAARLAPPPPGDEGAEAEAVGWSRNLSFDEAFADALGNLGGPMSLNPDELTTVSVVDISAMFGGIGGFHHLVVRVRR